MTEGTRIKTVEWVNGSVRLIDQTRLPAELVYLTFNEYPPLLEAITRLRVRGAPAIGIAAAFGVVLGLNASSAKTYDALQQEFENISTQFLHTRPTGVNLSHAMSRLKKILSTHKDKPPDELKGVLEQEAVHLYEEDRTLCRKIGHYGAELIKDGWTVLTHCNAGALATADYGTALGCIYAAVDRGKKIGVYVDETRPLLQGARLTAWELQQAGIEATLICDNMAAWVMKGGRVDCVIVGADRIVANGDVANKIGTYSLAVLAREHDIPFYVAAPTTTFDLSLDNGNAIPIEERDAAEVTEGFGTRTAPQNVNVFNPAFDVTPALLISAIICESGVALQPYDQSLPRLV